MAKQYDAFEISETGNWNVAKPYTELKIMKWLYFADEYETIARFGTSDFIDEFYIDNESSNTSRVKALKRLHHSLTKLIQNTYFAVKSTDKKILKGFLEDLELLEKTLNYAYKELIDQKEGTKKIKIKEDAFNFVLSMLIKIHSKILEPLNRADLIFTSVEEFDPKKIKERIKEDLINQG